MTVDQLIVRLQELSVEGHGALRVTYTFWHGKYGHETEPTTVEVAELRASGYASEYLGVVHVGSLPDPNTGLENPDNG